MSSIPRWPNKDPNEVLDYVVDWSKRLDDDVIDTSTWIMPDGITRDSDSKTDSTTRIFLSGGTLAQTYTLTNRITTTGGRTMDQSMRITIADR